MNRTGPCPAQGEQTVSLLSPYFRVNLRDFCSGRNGLLLRQISDMFEGAGIKLGPPPAIEVGGWRRTLTAQYLNTVDWDSEEDVGKVLQAVTRIFFASTTTPEHKEALRALC